MTVSKDTVLYATHTPESISIYRKGGSGPCVIQQAAPDQRPFIHPIAAPDGRGVLTENAPGHHPWQHGLYVGLNDVNGVGFWTEGLLGSPNDGTFHPRPLTEPVIIGNRADWLVTTEWRAPDGRLMLIESQQWTFTDHGSAYALDLHWTLHAEVNLEFGEYPYGGLFLRMPFRYETGGEARNDQGLAAPEAEGARARWVAVSMPIAGRDEQDWAGIAMMDHPDNPGYPVPWRVDNELGISPSYCRLGSWSIPQGESRLFKHRVLAYTGGSSPVFIETYWNSFAGRSST